MTEEKLCPKCGKPMKIMYYTNAPPNKWHCLNSNCRYIEDVK